MSKIAISILFGASLLASGCTVHHYHHNAPNKSAKKGHHGKRGGAHKGCSCAHRLPEGHPPVGEGMKGHGMDPHHGMKGHGMKGHGMDPHHGMKKGHGMKGHGMDPHHGSHVDQGAHDTKNPFAESHTQGAEHQAMPNLPAPVESFHDAFAAVWHLENDQARKETACAEAGNLKKLAAQVKAHKLETAQAAEFSSGAASLQGKIVALTVSCKRKNGDVQTALKEAHDALHGLFATLQKGAVD